MPYVLRPARASDAPFLTEMLIAAAFWRADGPVGTAQEVMSNPELAHYVDGWPRTGELGVVAEDKRPIGAAWMRYFSEDDPGFGFVDAAVPEVGMGVVKEWRGRGVGGGLLAALVDVARQQRVITLAGLASNEALGSKADQHFAGRPDAGAVALAELRKLQAVSWLEAAAEDVRADPVVQPTSPGRPPDRPLHTATVAPVRALPQVSKAC